MSRFVALTMLYVLSPELCADVGVRAGMVTLEIDQDAASGFVARVLAPHGVGSFGAGATQLDAVRDLVEVMRDEAAALRARQASLSVGMARELAVLDSVLIHAGGEAPRPTAYVVAPTVRASTGPIYTGPAGRNSYIPSAAAQTC